MIHTHAVDGGVTNEGYGIAVRTFICMRMDPTKKLKPAYIHALDILIEYAMEGKASGLKATRTEAFIHMLD